MNGSVNQLNIGWKSNRLYERCQMKLSINRKLTEHHLARLNPIELMVKFDHTFEPFLNFMPIFVNERQFNLINLILCTNKANGWQLFSNIYIYIFLFVKKIDSKLTKTKRVVQCQHSTRYPMYNMTIQMIGNIDKLSSQASSFSSPKANNRYSSIWFD